MSQFAKCLTNVSSANSLKKHLSKYYFSSNTFQSTPNLTPGPPALRPSGPPPAPRPPGQIGHFEGSFSTPYTNNLAESFEMSVNLSHSKSSQSKLALVE
jgi:hypothetical protein